MFWTRPSQRVLFICRENICRSPMAEGLLRQRLKDRGQQRRVAVDSAGVSVSQPGHRPDLRAKRIVADRGGSLAGIKARQVQPRDLERSDLVLAMEPSHLDMLQKICPPGHEHKLELVLNYAPALAATTIPDPYYGNREGFELVYDMLAQSFDGLLETLCENA